MKSPHAVTALAALAHAHRLAIYRLLVQSGPEGLSAGAIAEQVGMLPSSLTFHVQSLQRAGLVTQTRASRRILYAADFSTMNDLVDYLTENCCGTGASCATVCAPAAGKRVAAGSRRSA